MIPASDPGCLVGCAQERIGLGTGQEVDQLAVMTFGRHGKDPLDLGAVGRHLIRGVSEERPDRGQAQIAGAHADAPCLLHLGKEGGDERRIDHLERQPVGRGVQPLLRKAQQHPERVAVGFNRVGADPLLLHQPLREELLQERREGRDRSGCHGEASHLC